MANRKIEPTDGLEMFVNQQGSITMIQNDPIERSGNVIVIQLRDVPLVQRWLTELVAEARGK